LQALDFLALILEQPAGGHGLLMPPLAAVHPASLLSVAK
jgi:hypothetical protein